MSKLNSLSLAVLIGAASCTDTADCPERFDEMVAMGKEVISEFRAQGFNTQEAIFPRHELISDDLLGKSCVLAFEEKAREKIAEIVIKHGSDRPTIILEGFSKQKNPQAPQRFKT